MNMRKRITIVFAACILTASFSMPTIAGSWQQNMAYRMYLNDDGSYVTSNWKQIDNLWYHFDSYGYMQYGWHLIDGNWYYFNIGGDGSMATNTWVGSYYVGADGALLTDTITPDGYYVNENGEKSPTAATVSSPDILDVLRQYGSDPSLELNLNSYNFDDLGFHSLAFKRDGHYEITNAELVVPDLLDTSYVDTLKVGDSVICSDGLTYTVIKISNDYGARQYDLADANGTCDYYLLEEEDGRVYTLSFWDDLPLEKTVYSGSVYMSENCIITLIEPGSTLETRDFSVDAFLETQGSGSAYYSALFDADGVIIRLKEMYRP